MAVDWSPFVMQDLVKVTTPYVLHERTISAATMNYEDDTNVPEGAVEVDKERGVFRKLEAGSWSDLNIRTDTMHGIQKTDEVFTGTLLGYEANDLLVRAKSNTPTLIEGFLSVSFHLSPGDSVLDSNYFFGIGLSGGDTSKTRIGTICPQLDVGTNDNVYSKKVQGTSGNRGIIIANYTENVVRTDCFFYGVSEPIGEGDGYFRLEIYLNQNLNTPAITIHKNSYIRATGGIF